VVGTEELPGLETKVVKVALLGKELVEDRIDVFSCGDPDPD